MICLYENHGVESLAKAQMRTVFELNKNNRDAYRVFFGPSSLSSSVVSFSSARLLLDGRSPPLPPPPEVYTLCTSRPKYVCRCLCLFQSNHPHTEGDTLVRWGFLSIDYFLYFDKDSIRLSPRSETCEKMQETVTKRSTLRYVGRTIYV